MIPGRIESARRAGLAGALAVAAGTALLMASPGPLRNQPVPVALRQDAPAAVSVPRGPVSVTAEYQAGSDAPLEEALRATGLPVDSPELGWRPWAETGARRVTAASNSEAVPVVAFRTAGTLLILLGNNCPAYVEARVGARLPRGIYSVERIDLGTATARTSTVKRLMGAVLPEAGTASKPARIAPGQTLAYRFTNRLTELASDIRLVKAALGQVAAVRPDQARRLKVPLREAEAHVAALLGGAYRKSREQALRHTHRAILTVAHAQMLCNNGRGLGRIPPLHAEKLNTALAELEEHLTQISASYLGLTPDMEIEEGEGGLRVRLGLANGGSTSVPRVKIWITAPEGTVATPADKAAMGTLEPGQSVRAEFHVQAERQQAPGILGHISYYYARSPGHLRLRSTP